MKPTRLITMALLATAVLAVAGLTACSGSPDIVTTVVPPAAKESALTIALKPVDTRAAATNITTAGENTINRVAVGIFDSDHNVKMVKTFESSEIKSGTVTLTTTTALATTDHVLVACNAPANVFTGAIANEDAFRAKTITTDEALYGASTHTTTDAVDFTNLPMFGHVEALTQSSDDGTQFTANVSVYHLVAKITLESFTLDKQGAMADASFDPEGIFLAHVPDVLDFQNVTATTSEAAYFLTTPLKYNSYYHGDMTQKPADNQDGFLGKAYLGMDATKAEGSQTSSVNGLVAYTMPNSQTDDDKATFLVVKGKFHYKTGDAGTEVWYPLYINYSNTTGGKNVGDAKKVYPNFNYRMTVKVQGFGEKPAYDKNGNPVITPLVPRTVAVTVTPQGFVDAPSEVTLN
ncbi:fimbrial protein [Hallella absiana]|uniref:fimbrial protein n=1 Tax=Hallella absiana TaxID=2925336 RepID=UPI0021C8F9BF|nr:fimbrial protein [Hallella absiana]